MSRPSQNAAKASATVRRSKGRRRSVSTPPCATTGGQTARSERLRLVHQPLEGEARPVPFQHGEFRRVHRAGLAVPPHPRQLEDRPGPGDQEALQRQFRRGAEPERPPRSPGAEMRPVLAAEGAEMHLHARHRHQAGRLDLRVAAGGEEGAGVGDEPGAPAEEGQPGGEAFGVPRGTGRHCARPGRELGSGGPDRPLPAGGRHPSLRRRVRRRCPPGPRSASPAFPSGAAPFRAAPSLPLQVLPPTCPTAPPCPAPAAHCAAPPNSSPPACCPQAEREAAEAVAARYAVAVTPAVRRLIDPADPADPIARQYLPDAAELRTAPGEVADPTADAPFTPGEGRGPPLSRPGAAEAAARLPGVLPLLLPAGSGGAGRRRC